MKKILAFTLALAMVLSSTTMTFAASKEVEALANLKLLLNTTDAEVNADLNRAVGLAMVLKALGYTQEDANAKAEANTFVDMEKYGWAKGFTVLGEELKITNGTSVEPKMFSPNANLNERAFVAFMLRALGYDVDAAWAKAGELAKEAGVAETVTENKLTKGEAAVIMYKALMAKVQGDEKGRTLAQKLVDEKKLDKDLAVANGLISGEPEKLTVTAMADNLIEVTVSFDGTVDKETAEKTENYKIKSASVEKAKVQEDNKTVVLRLKDALANKKEFELVVSGVKNVAGVVMDKQTVKFATNDVTAPSVQKITVTGPKNFEVSFNEPMSLKMGKPTVKVQQGKSGSLQVKNSELKYINGDRVLAVELYSSFQEGKEYTVMIGDGKNNSSYPRDFANYTAPYYEEVITYAKDTTAPEVKVVKASQTEVTLEFTKPVKGLTKKHFSHTFSSYHPLGFKIEDETAMKEDIKGTSVSRVTLVFRSGETGYALPAGDVKLMVLGKEGSNKIQDNWANQLADTELVVSVVADREAPEVASVDVKDKDTVEVTFTEEIYLGKVEASDWRKEVTVELLDKDGKVVQKNTDVTLAKKADNKKVVVIDFKKTFVGKTMTLVLKGVKDNSLYRNMMSDYSTEVTFGDKELVFNNDNVKVEYKVKEEGKEYFLYVTFNEEMDDTALDLANYRLKNSADGPVKLKGSAEFFEGNRKIVAIELTHGDDSDVKFLTNQNAPAASVGLHQTPKLVLSNNIKDLAGNVNESFEFAREVESINEAKFKVKEVRAVANNKVEVEMESDIAEYDLNTAHYVLKSTKADNSNEYTYKITDIENKSSKVLVITVEKTDTAPLLPGNPEVTDAGVDNRDVKLTLANNEMKNAFGLPVDTDEAHKVKDKIKPEVSKVSVAENGKEVEAEIFEEGVAKSEDYKDRVRVLTLLDTDNALDGGNHEVYVVFSEKVTNASLSNTTFTVSEGWSVESAATVADNANRVVKLTIRKAGGTEAELKVLRIAQQSAIRDEKGNVLEGDKVERETLFLKAADAAEYLNGVK